ncbi:MAG: FeoB-associated Cys-rich membrane protein [Proteobacteria bacterium]|nr:FeoB-associated Cys-rich membrane protein [Pseudomonadota bacterium]
MGIVEGIILLVIFTWAGYVVFRFFKKSGQGECSGCDSSSPCKAAFDQNRNSNELRS